MPFFKKLLKVPLVVYVMLIVFIGIIIYINSNNSKNSLSNNISQQSDSSFNPYEDLTIPYLRNKTYSSKLNKLTKIAENSKYTSYITSYKSDGLEINGLLTIPTGSKPKGGFSAIVFVHGYIPPSEYKTTEKYVDYVDYLARNGFIVFKIDLRGNGQSQGQASGAYFSSGYVIDTLNAYSSLQNTNYINPGKIGLWGHSMAGNVVMRATAVKPLIPATSIWAGAVYTYFDQREYGINDLSYLPSQITNANRNNSRQSIFEKVGTPSASNKFWKLVAPTSFLNDFQGAIQINHALDDTVVDIRYSQNLNSLLNNTQIPHEFYTYPSGGHNISGNSFSIAMKRTADFFDKYLKNDYLVI